MFDVQLDKNVDKFLSSCDKILFGRFTEKIDFLENNPIPSDARRLKGTKYWRLRVGDYRIIYRVDYEMQKIFVTKIGHRSNVYDGLS